jgi:hypothetical protein
LAFSARYKRCIVAAVTIVALAPALACSDYDQDRADVIECEGAAAHIKKCCGSVPGISCVYAAEAPSLFCEPDTDGKPCPTTYTYPDFNETQSRCVQRASCAEIISLSGCSVSASELTTGLGCGS